MRGRKRISLTENADLPGRRQLFGFLAAAVAAAAQPVIDDPVLAPGRQRPELCLEGLKFPLRNRALKDALIHSLAMIRQDVGYFLTATIRGDVVGNDNDNLI